MRLAGQGAARERERERALLAAVLHKKRPAVVEPVKMLRCHFLENRVFGC